MTEICFNRKSFISTLETFQTRFELATSKIVLETDDNGDRFILTAQRKDAPEVRAFGPCAVKGSALNVEIDLVDLKNAIEGASLADDNLTLLIGDGLWVKETGVKDED